MKIKAILNLDEGVYLEMGHIISLGVNEIPIDHEGNTAFALLAYPSPGAGYKIGLFDDANDAKNAMLGVISASDSGSYEGSTYTLSSNYTAPVVAEEQSDAPTIGAADLQTVEEILDSAVPCEGPCEGCEEDCANKPSIDEEAAELNQVEEIETPVEETAQETEDAQNIAPDNTPSAFQQ